MLKELSVDLCAKCLTCGGGSGFYSLMSALSRFLSASFAVRSVSQQGCSWSAGSTRRWPNCFCRYSLIRSQGLCCWSQPNSVHNCLLCVSRRALFWLLHLLLLLSLTIKEIVFLAAACPFKTISCISDLKFNILKVKNKVKCNLF